MPTLMFTLDAPMQAWGVTEQGAARPTGNHPSKSGVIGMLAAALGRDRRTDLSDLFALRFAVRVDRPGVLVTDFHTARSVNSPDQSLFGDLGFPESPEYGPSALTHRGYLSDATFTVALTGPRGLVEQLERALLTPVYLLYLGRRGCPVPYGFRGTVVDAENPVQALQDPAHAYIPEDGDTRPFRREAAVVYADADCGGEGPTALVSDVHTIRDGWTREFGRRAERTITTVTPERTPEIIGLD